MNKKISQVVITRTYNRKIKSDKDYEMIDIGSTYQATLSKPTEDDIIETSEYLYKKAEAEVDIQVDIRQNPGKVVRGYASINELKTIVRHQNKKLEEQEIEINKLKEEIKNIPPFK